MRSKLVPVVVESEPRTDGMLSVIQVREHECVLSTGESLYIRYEKLRVLAETICQERCPVIYRAWWTKDDGNELIELHRVGAPSTSGCTATPSDSSNEAF